VLAAVSCWGAVVAGTQGLRAEHARIDALWLARQVPPAVRHRVASRYPSARIYGDRAAMLAEHPPTQLPCYAPAPPRHLGRWAAALLAAVTIVALGVVPIGVLRATAPLWALWLLATATLGAGALWLLLGPRGTGHRAAGVVVAEVFAWVVSPAVGMAGWLLRVPVLRALLVAGFGYLRTLRPGYFPVEHAPRERPFCGVRV